MNWSVELKNYRMKLQETNIEEWLAPMGDRMRRYNIHLIGIPERQTRENGKEGIL